MNKVKSISRASAADTARVLVSVVLPTFGKGVIMRRPSVEGTAARGGLDMRAVRVMQRLRAKYGSRPLFLKIPFRPQLLLLDPKDVEFVLENSPQPFATATMEKRAALAHLEPGNVLISDASHRAETRPLHERALATHKRIHPMARHFGKAIEEEIETLLDGEARNGLNWALFSHAWFRIVRRIVLGDAAGGDVEVTDQLNRLRGRANWAYFLRRDKRPLETFQHRLRTYIDTAEADSLVARIPKDRRLDPESQITQWLFAFDPAGMATFRTLALLAAHPAQMKRVRKEALKAGADRPLTRACLLECLRLWPTTPAILRELTQDMSLDNGKVAKGTGIIIFTPFFHRDEVNLPFAHRLEPKLWTEEDTIPAKGLVPFSAGPAICPAHNLVPLVASLALGAILSKVSARNAFPKLDPEALPGTLNHFEIRLDVLRL